MVNDWGGEGRPSVKRPNVAQATVLDYIGSVYRDFGPRPDDYSSAGALCALCHSRAGYASMRADVQPYAKERVSRPPPSEPSDISNVCWPT